MSQRGTKVKMSLQQLSQIANSSQTYTFQTPLSKSPIKSLAQKNQDIIQAIIKTKEERDKKEEQVPLKKALSTNISSESKKLIDQILTKLGKKEEQIIEKPQQDIEMSQSQSQNINTAQILDFNDFKQSIVEFTLSLSIMKKFQNLQELQQLSQSILMAEIDLQNYQLHWKNLILYELYSELIDPEASTQSSLESSSPSIFLFDQKDIRLTFAQEDNKMKALKQDDIVMLTFNQIIFEETVDQRSNILAHLMSNIESTGKLFLAKVEIDQEQMLSLRVSRQFLSMLCTVQAKTRDQKITCFIHHLTNISHYLRSIDSLDNLSSSSFLPIILNPRAQRQVHRRPNSALDKKQGQMEIFINEAKQLTKDQNQILRRMAHISDNEVYILKGAAGTGKTILALNYISMCLSAGVQQIVYCVSQQSILNQTVQDLIQLDIVHRQENAIANLYLDNTSLVENLTQDECQLIKSISQVLKSTLEEFNLLKTRYDELLNELKGNHMKEEDITDEVKLQIIEAIAQDVNNYSKIVINLKQLLLRNDLDDQTIKKEILSKLSLIFVTHQQLQENQLLSDTEILIIDDAQSMTELKAIEIISQLKPKSLILMGDPQLPRGFCFQKNLNLTHFNKSFFERLIDNEARYEGLKFEIRSHKILIEFISKSFYEEKLKKFRIEDDNIYFKDVNNRSPLARIMKRIFFFDLIYLKELKDQVFASDFDEVRFTYNLIMDVTRLMSENESKFTQHGDDTFQCQTAYRAIKGKIGIIVPFQRYVLAMTKMIPEGFQRKFGASITDIMIGTPDMFRGVSKDLIIISCLRNSMTEGLGYFNQDEFINLALSRANKFVWVIGNSQTLNESRVWTLFVKYCQYISNEHCLNYVKFENRDDARGEKMRRLLKSFSARPISEEEKQQRELNDKKQNGGRFDKVPQPHRITFLQKIEELANSNRNNYRKRSYQEMNRSCNNFNDRNKTVERSWFQDETTWGGKGQSEKKNQTQINEDRWDNVDERQTKDNE